MAKIIKILGFFSMLFMLGSQISCKKAVDKAEENAAYDIITNGRWQIVKFDSANTSLLPEYAAYEFQFFKSGVVTAYLSGGTGVNGSWLGRQETLAIESNFPGVGNPLKRLNGTWQITGATEVSVRGTRTEAFIEYTLWLKKI